MRELRQGYVPINPKKLKAARGSWRRPADVARHLEVKPQVLWAWENISKSIPDDKLTELCKLYEIDRAQVVVSNGAKAGA